MWPGVVPARQQTLSALEDLPDNEAVSFYYAFRGKPVATCFPDGG